MRASRFTPMGVTDVRMRFEGGASGGPAVLLGRLGGRGAMFPSYLTADSTSAVNGLGPADVSTLHWIFRIAVAGVIAFIKPVRAMLLDMTFWGLWTACLRPLAGEGVWELIERAGNFGVPLAFLALAGWPQLRIDWVTTMEAPVLTPKRARLLAWILRVTTGLLLIGHGGFGAVMHKDWTGYFAAIGIGAATVDARSLTTAVGWFEIALGLLVLAWPRVSLLAFVFGWKIATEWLRPLAGEPLWEFIERFGNFAAPLALLYLIIRDKGVVVWTLGRKWRSYGAAGPGNLRNRWLP